MKCYIVAHGLFRSPIKEDQIDVIFPCVSTTSVGYNSSELSAVGMRHSLFFLMSSIKGLEPFSSSREPSVGKVSSVCSKAFLMVGVVTKEIAFDKI